MSAGAQCALFSFPVVSVHAPLPHDSGIPQCAPRTRAYVTAPPALSFYVPHLYHPPALHPHTHLPFAHTAPLPATHTLPHLRFRRSQRHVPVCVGGSLPPLSSQLLLLIVAFWDGRGIDRLYPLFYTRTGALTMPHTPHPHYDNVHGARARFAADIPGYLHQSPNIAARSLDRFTTGSLNSPVTRTCQRDPKDIAQSCAVCQGCNLSALWHCLPTDFSYLLLRPGSSTAVRRCMLD